MVDLLSRDAEILWYIRRRGTVGGGAITARINERDIASIWGRSTTNHVDGRSDRDVGRDLDLEWNLRDKGVAGDEIHSLLGSDVCRWVDLGETGQVRDVETDKYVGIIITHNLHVCVCVSHGEQE